MSRRLVLILLGVFGVMAGGAYLLLNMSMDTASTTSPAPASAPAAAPATTRPVSSAPKPADTKPAPRKPAISQPAVSTAPATPPPAAVAPVTATLHIDSDVAGAQVFLDRNFIGNAPATVNDVAPGQHRLNVSAAGFDGYADTIDVAAGPRDIMVRLKDVKLDATIAVVHKHAFGSCKGTLSATPLGIRYETSNAGDAFAAAFADVVAFDVDYVEKNLKVKLKNGKQYNFTDAEGNADRLYLFHSDVNAVREKVRKGGGE